MHDIALTIAIPTFNRSPLLEKRLAWLSRALRRSEPRCEVLISDNCSSDDTPDVIARWRARHGGKHFKVNRHARNIGAIRNIAWCIQATKGRHVWVVSDDDLIKDGAVDKVTDTLGDVPDLALLILNFSSRDVVSGEMRFEHCFEVIQEGYRRPNGKDFFEQYFQTNRWGGLALTTALIYRTDLAQDALRRWPAGLDNLTLQLYITGLCALEGDITVTDDVYIERAAGRAHFLEDKQGPFALSHGRRGRGLPPAGSVGLFARRMPTQDPGLRPCAPQARAQIRLAVAALHGESLGSLPMGVAASAACRAHAKTSSSPMVAGASDRRRGTRSTASASRC